MYAPVGYTSPKTYFETLATLSCTRWTTMSHEDFSLQTYCEHWRIVKRSGSLNAFGFTHGFREVVLQFQCLAPVHGQGNPFRPKNPGSRNRHSRCYHCDRHQSMIVPAPAPLPRRRCCYYHYHGCCYSHQQLHHPISATISRWRACYL